MVMNIRSQKRLSILSCLNGFPKQGRISNWTGMRSTLILVFSLMLFTATEARADNVTVLGAEAVSNTETSDNTKATGKTMLTDNGQTFPSSGLDLTGDKIVLKSKIHNLKQLNDNDKNWIALRGTVLHVTQGQGKKLNVVVDSARCIKVIKNGISELESRYNYNIFRVGYNVDCEKEEDNIDNLVSIGELYQLDRNELERHGYFSAGWVYGMLLVPYKYHFDDKSFSSETTIGPYLGYSLGGIGTNVAAIVSAGVSNPTVANPDGSGDTSTTLGFSLALGLIGSVSKNNSPIQLGVVFGKDWAGSNSVVPYKHEGKTWGAVMIGFNFSQSK